VSRTGAWSAARGLFVLGAVVITLAAACGKKGPPRPPLRPNPGRVADLAVRAIDERIEFTFTIPAANADGTTPPALDRVEIYGLQAPDADPAPAPASIAAPENLKLTIGVVPAGDPDPEVEAPDAVRHGDLVTVADRVGAVPEGTVLRYLAVGVTGRRRGATSGVVAIEPALRPPAPTGLLFEYDQTEVSLSWLGSAAADAFHVYRAGTAEGDDVRLTAAPVDGPAFSTLVEFGTPRCFNVRAVHVEGAVSIESAKSRPICLTAVDRFAPPAPTALQAIADAGGVTLSWSGVDAADLAGYLVLRGEGAGETLVPLTDAPVTGQSYRDTTVSPGVTYTYAVVSVDGVTPPNRSGESNRQVVTVR
jgi:hypothetical protein